MCTWRRIFIKQEVNRHEMDNNITPTPCFMFGV